MREFFHMILHFLVFVSILCSFAVVNAFQLNPPLQLQRQNIHLSCTSKNSRSSIVLRLTNSDSVLVIGGTSGIGQLVTEKLAKLGNTVKATSRSKSRGEEIFQNKPNVEIVELDLLSDDTTNLQQALQGVSAVVVSVGTTAFPTMKWKGGNTPQAIDEDAVTRIAKTIANDSASSIEKVVLITSVGVERTGQMPFLILNLFGVLDAKRAGEDAIKSYSSQSSYKYVIVRPGRLIGGPFTNLDVAKLLQIEGGAENGVDIAFGDDLLGDCKRDACAEGIVQCLYNPIATNIEFSIISNDEKALTDDQWTKVFESLNQR